MCALLNSTRYAEGCVPLGRRARVTKDILEDTFPRRGIPLRSDHPSASPQTWRRFCGDAHRDVNLRNSLSVDFPGIFIHLKLRA